MSLALTRRTLLAGVAAGTALASTRLVAATGETIARSVIVQPNLQPQVLQAIAARHAGAAMFELEMDVVRQWRAVLSQQLQGTGPTAAYVPWAQANILAGLAREAGGKSRITTFAPSLFEVSLSLPASSTAGAA